MGNWSYTLKIVVVLMLMLTMFCNVICSSERRTNVKFSITITNLHKHFTLYWDTFIQFVSYMFRPLFGQPSMMPLDEYLYWEQFRKVLFIFSNKITGDLNYE